MPKQSLQSIQVQIKKLQAKAELLKSRNKKPALNLIIKTMRENEISIAELEEAMKKTSTQRKRAVEPRASGKIRKPIAAKYINPQTKETWTGRGRTPRWLSEAEAAGKSRNDFAV